MGLIERPDVPGDGKKGAIHAHGVAPCNFMHRMIPKG